MAKITYGMCTSHIPSIGVAIDQHKEKEEYWQPFFKGIEPIRSWHAQKENNADVIIIVYNDHASAFALDNISTFTLGVSDFFESADEGYGPRPIPDVEGDSEFAWHLFESLILDEFDMAISNKMPVDHGLTVPLSIAYNRPEKWPVKVIPLAVNVIQYPPPTANRCYNLGKAIKKAVNQFDKDLKVSIWGTGGMSHQLQGERSGLINVEYDLQFLDNLVNNPIENTKITHTDLMRYTGSEGIELVMWNIMRGALNDKVEELYRFTLVPVSNTHYGNIILKNGE